MSVSLQSQLDAFQLAFRARVDRSLSAMIDESVDSLRAQRGDACSTGIGAQFPAQTDLRDSEDRPFRLDAVLGESPAVILMYRGGWCPYCNLTLRAYQDAADKLAERGVRLLAIAPERPVFLKQTAERNDLSFPLLSDRRGALAKALGIEMTVPEGMRPFFDQIGHSLPRRNDDPSWKLPLPAVYVVAKGGRIADVFVDPDYRKRPDPALVLERLAGAKV
jgi:peroxiredoxin